MQKLLPFLVLALLVANMLFASNPSNISPNIFRDDLSKLDCDMDKLSQLEQLAYETKATQSQLVKEGNPLAQYIVQDGDISASLLGGSAPEQERLMGVPGFLWGFCCSGFGVLLVYLSIDDPAAKKKEGVQAIIGCAIGTVLWLGLYVWLLLSVSYY